MPRAKAKHNTEELPLPEPPVQPEAQVEEPTPSGPAPPDDFKDLGKMFSLKDERAKYPLLQQRQLMYFRLDVETTARMIQLLEDTGWTQTDAGSLMAKQFFMFTKHGIFQKLFDKQLFESDGIKDLRKIRDMFKPIGPELLEVMKASVWKHQRLNAKTTEPSNGSSATTTS